MTKYEPQTSWVASAGIECFSEVGLNERLFGDYDVRWEMELCEKAGMLRVLEQAKAEVAIEIGTSNGGSLSAIARHAGKVFTLDLNPRAKEKVGFNYENVEYVSGDSRETLPALLTRISESHDSLGFILVDGGHETECVRADLNAILTYKPVRPLWIVMHDTFNPPCREGIRSACWAESPHVHFVELDYVPGILHSKVGLKRQMWGGLALALMLPEEAAAPIVIQARQEYLYKTVYRHSAHSPVPRVIRGLLRALKLS